MKKEFEDLFNKIEKLHNEFDKFIISLFAVIISLIIFIFIIFFILWKI